MTPEYSLLAELLALFLALALAPRPWPRPDRIPHAARLAYLCLRDRGSRLINTVWLKRPQT